ncbi:hypothetical protein LCGC14_2599740, partial [marine sediment metagenome]
LTVDTINETTANNGVVIESVTILDGGLSATAQITTSSTISATGDIQTAGELVADVVTEAIAGTGVTVDSVLLKDGGATLSGSLLVDTITEYTNRYKALQKETTSIRTLINRLTDTIYRGTQRKPDGGTRSESRGSPDCCKDQT